MSESEQFGYQPGEGKITNENFREQIMRLLKEANEIRAVDPERFDAIWGGDNWMEEGLHELAEEDRLKKALGEE